MKTALPSVRAALVAALSAGGSGLLHAMPAAAPGMIDTTVPRTSWIVSRDITGDGKSDLLFPGATGSAVRLVRGIGDGTYAPAVTLGAPDTTVARRNGAVADLNGDALPDLVFYDESTIGAKSVNLTVILQNAGGGFAGALELYFAMPGAAATNAPLVVADLDRDGLPDIATAVNSAAAGADNDLVHWYRNLGGGNFAAGVTAAVGLDSPSALSVVDFDHDGVPDLAIADTENSRLVIRQGPNFSIGTTVALTFKPRRLACADADADGREDFFVTGGESLFGAGTTYLARVRNSGGVFGPDALAILRSTPDVLGSLIVPDLDADRLPDPVCTSMQGDWLSSGASRMLSMLTWPGTAGSYTESSTPMVKGQLTQAISCADDDHDGDQDFFIVTIAGVVRAKNDTTRRQWTADLAGSRNLSAIGGVKIDTADMDRDGDSDVVAACFGDNSLKWYAVNSTNGTIAAPVSIATVTSLRSFALGDIDRDGDTDVVSASGNSTIGLHRQSGAWVNTSMANLNMTDIHLADLDRDGDPDIFGGSDAGDVYVRLNTTNMNNWGSLTISTNSSQIYRVEAADVFPGGWLEIVIKRLNNSTAVLSRNAQGVWSATEAGPAGPAGSFSPGMCVTDFDGDGDLDIMSAENAVFYPVIQESPGVFKRVIPTYGAPYDILALLSADLDLDGKSDRLSVTDRKIFTWRDQKDFEYDSLPDESPVQYAAATGNFGGDAAPDVAYVTSETNGLPKLQLSISSAPQMMLSGGNLMPGHSATPSVAIAGALMPSLRMTFTNNGRSDELAARPDRIKVTFTRTSGSPGLTGAEMGQLFDSIELRQDTVNPGVTDPDDVLLAKITSFSPASGTLTFANLSAALPVPAASEGEIHVILKMKSSAASAAVTGFRMHAWIPAPQDPTLDTGFSTTGAVSTNLPLSLYGATQFAYYQVGLLTPIQLWRQTHFGNPYSQGIGANTADPDHDGIPNLVEYACNSLPMTRDADGGKSFLMSAPFTSPSGWQVSFSLAATPRPDIAVRLQRAEDLLGPDYNPNAWSETNSRFGAGNWTFPSNVLSGPVVNGRQSFTVRMSETGPARQFYRLYVQEYID